MSLGFRILAEAESETRNLLTVLLLKTIDTSLVHGQSFSALILHQAWWNSITNYIQFALRGATTCSASACTVQIWRVMSQFSSTQGTADKDEEWWNFEGGESSEGAWTFPCQLSHPSWVSGGRWTSTLAVYVTFDLGDAVYSPSSHRMRGCSDVESNTSPNTAIFLSLSWCLM